MNIFVDYLGHSDLHYGLHSLFEKRLKANLYRTIGSEWNKKGFHYNRDPNPTERNGEVQLVDGVYHIPMKMEKDGGYYVQKAITFDKFLKMDFDVGVTTCSYHEKAFQDVLRQHKPNAIFVRQIANIGERSLGFCRNILLGQPTSMASNINYIKYHPEHYEGYVYTPPTNHKTVNSFVGCLPSFTSDLRTWKKGESSMKDFTFKMHGQNGRDGAIPHLLMPQAMKDSAFIWHVKAHGGGGFVARQALASGRPCIIRKQYAIDHNELAKDLFLDSVNCIDLNLGVERGIKKIREWSQPDRHVEVCKAIAEKFKKDVNFAVEAKRIKEWLGGLEADK